MSIKKGKLIILEGPDTAGKTTLINKLKEVLPIIYTDEIFLFTREPGNLLDNSLNNKSESIRKNLLTNKDLNTDQQAKLFAESRYYHVLDIIEQLNKGKNIIVDRFIFSSLLYQGPIIGFNKVLNYNKEILKLLKDNDIELNNLILQISIETYNKRMANKTKDAIEDVDDFTIKQRILYHNTIDDLNKDFDNAFGKIFTIDANNTPSNVLIASLNYIDNIIK